MPHGYFTVEQWKRSGKGTTGQWVPITHFNSTHSLTTAMSGLKHFGEPGLFRISQMQRCVWAEVENGKLRLHGSHASSPENLSKIVEIFEHEHGCRPIEKAREARAEAKARQESTAAKRKRSKAQRAGRQ